MIGDLDLERVFGGFRGGDLEIFRVGDLEILRAGDFDFEGFRFLTFSFRLGGVGGGFSGVLSCFFFSFDLSRFFFFGSGVGDSCFWTGSSGWVVLVFRFFAGWSCWGGGGF